MAYSTDKYELPIAAADTVVELARKLHITSNAVSSMICKEHTNGKTKGYTIERIEIDDYDDPLGNIPCPCFGERNLKRWERMKEERKEENENGI